MERFEDFAKRLFSVAKKDAEAVKEKAEELATDLEPKRDEEPTGE